MSFPTPVGGTPFPDDFAPSVVFAVLYGLLVPLMLFRIFDKHSRTTLLIGSIVFGIERIVIFSLRATQSTNDAKRHSTGLFKYMQASFALGFIGIAADLANILRVYLVNPTYGSEKYVECPSARDELSERKAQAKLNQTPAATGKFSPWSQSRPRPPCKGAYPGEPPEGTPDHPRTRAWGRRVAGLMNLAFLASSVPGGVVNAQYDPKPTTSNKIMTLRYESTAVGVFLIFIIAGATVWGRLKLPRVSTQGAHILSILCILLTITGIYRLSVMYHTTTSLTSQAPGSLNSHSAKAAFYILHILPEWLSLAVLFGCNVRRVFGTGIAGDLRHADETPKQREKREKREEKRKEKKEREERERREKEERKEEVAKYEATLRRSNPLEVV